MDTKFELPGKENNLNQQCIEKINTFLNSSLNLYDLGLEFTYVVNELGLEFTYVVNEIDYYINCIFYFEKHVLERTNHTKARRHLLNARKVLNKEESEYLYNYMTEKQSPHFIWRNYFVNCLLIKGAILTKIENDLIIEEIII